MERKEFLVASGMLITSAMVPAWVIDSDGAISKESKEEIRDRRPDPSAFEEPILKALTLSINAPNPHNTQAWKFKIVNDKQAILYVDKKKLLLATDPPGRQIHIGCGSFVALFRMAASSLGYLAVVDYLPEGEYALNEAGNKPVARLTLEVSNIKTDVLFKHVYARQTNRGIYSGAIITQSELNSITGLSLPGHAHIQLHADPLTFSPLLDLLYKGMEVECFDWNPYDESRQWLRVKADIASKRDGINMRTSGMKGFKR